MKSSKTKYFTEDIIIYDEAMLFLNKEFWTTSIFIGMDRILRNDVCEFVLVQGQQGLW